MTAMENMKDGSIRCRWMYNHCKIMPLSQSEGGEEGYKRALIC